MIQNLAWHEVSFFEGTGRFFLGSFYLRIQVLKKIAMKRSYWFIIIALVLGGSTLVSNGNEEAAAKASLLQALKAKEEGKGCQVYGEIEFVDHHGDYEVEFVDHHADLEVEYVDHHADDVGEWEIVDHHGDYEIERVDHHGDFTVEVVDHHPGCN